MENYRQQMYSRSNRRMRQYQNQPCGCGVTPIIEAETREDLKSEYCGEMNADKCIDKLPLAMAYVPMQKWRKVCDGDAGLKAGTIFQELQLPFYGDRNSCGMRGDRS